MKKLKFIYFLLLSICLFSIDVVAQASTHFKCSGGKGQSYMMISYDSQSGIRLQTYASQLLFPQNSLSVSNDGIFRGAVEKMVRYSGGQEEINSIVEIEIKVIDSRIAGRLVILENLSFDGNKISGLTPRILKCR